MSIEAGPGLPAAAPGVYPVGGPGTGLRYWDGTQWDGRPVADTWTRVWCNVLDVVLASIVWVALGMAVFLPIVVLTPSTSTEAADNPAQSLLSILTLLVAFGGYFAVAYRVWGRTPAMMLGNLWVVHIPTGAQRLTWGTAIGRAMGLLLGYACGIMTLIWLISTASSRTKQGPHDSWARTAVLRGAKPLPPEQVRPSSLAAPQALTPPTTPAQAPASPQPQPTPPMASEAAAASTSPPYPGPVTAVAETPQRRSRAPWIIGGAIGAVVLAALTIVGAVWLDSRARENTMAQLMTGVEKSEQLIVDYTNDPDWGDIKAKLDAGMASTGQSEELRQRTWENFVYATTDLASTYVAPIQGAILDVEEVSPLPWHSDIAEAKEAYLEHARTWQEAIERRTKHTAQDQEVPGLAEGLDADISSTWVVAQRAMQRVTILGMSQNLQRRIDRLFD